MRGPYWRVKLRLRRGFERDARQKAYLKYVTGAWDFRNEASGVISRA